MAELKDIMRNLRFAHEELLAKALTLHQVMENAVVFAQELKAALEHDYAILKEDYQRFCLMIDFVVDGNNSHGIWSTPSGRPPIEDWGIEGFGIEEDMT